MTFFWSWWGFSFSHLVLVLKFLSVYTLDYFLYNIMSNISSVSVGPRLIIALNKLQSILKIENHKTPSLGECPICFEPMQLATTCLLECHHLFHRRCLMKWYKRQRNCPMCRRNIPLREVVIPPPPHPTEDRPPSPPPAEITNIPYCCCFWRMA